MVSEKEWQRPEGKELWREGERKKEKLFHSKSFTARMRLRG